MNKIKKIPKSGKLRYECTRIIKTALKSDALMRLETSELNSFFDEKLNCKLYKLQYDNETDLKLVKSIITNKIKGRNRILAIMRGNKNTTLDNLNSIWTVILKNVKNVSWGYYFGRGRGYDNSLYLLTY